MTTLECPTCNYAYDVPEPGEYGRASAVERAHFDAQDAEHRTMHDKKVAVFDQLEYWPRGTRERKELEEAGWRDLSAPDRLTQLCGAHALAQAWFDRSLDRAVECDCWHDHPRDWMEFESLLDLHAFLPDDVAEHLRASAGPPTGPIIGASRYWEPPEL